MIRQSVLFPEPRRAELVGEPCPEPKAGELLVETTRTLISTGTESIIYTADYAPDTHWDRWAKFPFRPGYSHVGRVIQVGEGVTGWNIGDRVMTRAGHTSHAAVSAKSAVRVPEGVSDEDATWTGIGKITQVGVRAAEHALGDSVVVIGLGLLGQLVVQYVRLLGARDIIAIDTAPKRLRMAEAHGATQTLELPAAEAREAVFAATGDRGADVVYDVTGHFAVFPSALALARRFGTVVVLGDTGSPGKQTLTPDVITRGLRIVGAHDTHAPFEETPHTLWTDRRVKELFLTYLERGWMRVGDLITHRFAPQQAQGAYDLLQRDRANVMGVVFLWADGR